MDSMFNRVGCFVNHLLKWGKERFIYVTNQIKIVLEKQRLNCMIWWRVSRFDRFKVFVLYG